MIVVAIVVLNCSDDAVLTRFLPLMLPVWQIRSRLLTKSA
jgi:hypothetical protein